MKILTLNHALFIGPSLTVCSHTSFCPWFQQHKTRQNLSKTRHITFSTPPL